MTDEDNTKLIYSATITISKTENKETKEKKGNVNENDN